MDYQERYVKFCYYSETIRLMPENFLVASVSGNYVVVDMDFAIEKDLAAYMFLLTRDYHIGHNYLEFIEKVNDSLSHLGFDCELLMPTKESAKDGNVLWLLSNGEWQVGSVDVRPTGATHWKNQLRL